METEKIGRLPCEQCGKFITIKYYKRHIKTHNRKRKRFECHVCKYSFFRNDYLRKHLKVKHNIGEYSISFLECIFCNKQLPSPFTLEVHLRSHTNERPFSCEICSSAFFSKHNLSVHVDSHQSFAEKKYKCNLCPKRFARVWVLQQHLQCHTGEKMHKCPIANCTTSTSFLNPHDLKRHHRIIHLGEKDFSCKTCPKKFSSNYHLKKHLRVHAREKPFSCNICGRNFSEAGSVNVHMRTHTGERPFKCIICGKTFTTSGNCKNHEKLHPKTNS